MNSKMSPDALRLKREYQKAYRKKHPEKVRNYIRTYWQRQADKQMVELATYSEQIIDLYKHGLCEPRVISLKLNISESTVYRVIIDFNNSNNS